MLKMWLFAAMNMLMVVFSPLVWYHHSIFLLLPLVLLLFHRSGAYWAAGMGLLLIIQAERLIEHMTGPVGVAVLFAHLALAVAAISIYLDGWRRDITTRRLANASLGASRLSRREHAGECRYD